MMKKKKKKKKILFPTIRNRFDNEELELENLVSPQIIQRWKIFHFVTGLAGRRVRSVSVC